MRESKSPACPLLYEIVTILCSFLRGRDSVPHSFAETRGKGGDTFSFRVINCCSGSITLLINLKHPLPSTLLIRTKFKFHSNKTQIFIRTKSLF